MGEINEPGNNAEYVAQTPEERVQALGLPTEIQTQKNKRRLVGVTRNLDGSLDYSRAAYEIGNSPDDSKKTLSTDEIWKDEMASIKEENQATTEVVRRALLEEKGDVAVREWLMSLFNKGWEKTGLTAEDIDSMVVIAYKAKAASEIAGTEIERSVLLFGSIPQFQKMISTLYPSLDGARGIVIPGKMFHESSSLHKTGIIVSTNNLEFIEHEILHTVDPFVDERSGVDFMLTEAFAYLQASMEANAKNKWGYFLSNFDSNLYYENNNKGAPDKITREKFSEEMVRMVEAIKAIYDKKGSPETQRIIGLCKTIDELVAKSLEEES